MPEEPKPESPDIPPSTPVRGKGPTREYVMLDIAAIKDVPVAPFSADAKTPTIASEPMLRREDLARDLLYDFQVVELDLFSEQFFDTESIVVSIIVVVAVVLLSVISGLHHYHLSGFVKSLILVPIVIFSLCQSIYFLAKTYVDKSIKLVKEALHLLANLSE